MSSPHWGQTAPPTTLHRVCEGLVHDFLIVRALVLIIVVARPLDEDLYGFNHHLLPSRSFDYSLRAKHAVVNPGDRTAASCTERVTHTAVTLADLSVCSAYRGESRRYSRITVGPFGAHAQLSNRIPHVRVWPLNQNPRLAHIFSETGEIFGFRY